MLAKISKSSLLNVQKRVLTRTFIATPAVKYENDRPSFNPRARYVSPGSGYGQSDMGERRSYQPRGNDNLHNVCHKCGSSEHFIKDCPEKQPVACYRCGQEGHIARNCTEAVETARAVTCHNCGEEGHIARMCPQGRRSDDGEGGYGLGREGRRPMMDRRRGNELSDVNGGDELSMRAQARDESEVVCWHCSEKGHSSRNCPTKPAEPCWNCGVEGHHSRECPQPRKDGRSRSTAGGAGRGGSRGGGWGGRGQGGRTRDQGWESRRGAMGG